MVPGNAVYNLDILGSNSKGDVEQCQPTVCGLQLGGHPSNDSDYVDCSVCLVDLWRELLDDRATSVTRTLEGLETVEITVQYDSAPDLPPDDD